MNSEGEIWRSAPMPVKGLRLLVFVWLWLLLMFIIQTMKCILNNCDCKVPVRRNPSCPHTTLASVLSQRSSHTVPQALLTQTSTLPWLEFVPSTSLMSPLTQPDGDGHKQSMTCIFECICRPSAKCTVVRCEKVYTKHLLRIHCSLWKLVTYISQEQ